VMMRNKILFSFIIIGVFFILFSALGSADLYLNSKVGTIYFNTSGVARASIGPGGNFSINTSDFFVNTNLGRVGIGTVNPVYKLDVQSASGDSVIRASSSAGLGGVYITGSSRAEAIFYDSGAGSDQKRKFIINDDGSLRFGKNDDAWSTNTNQLIILNDG